MTRAGLVDQAVSIINSRPYLWIYDSSTRVEFTTALVKAGRLEDAVESANEIEDDGYRASALCEVSIALAREGKVLRSKVVADSAISAAQEAWNEHSGVEGLSLIANAFAAAELKEYALTIAHYSLITAELIAREGVRSTALCEAARIVAKVGDERWAVDVAREAVSTAENVWTDDRSMSLQKAALMVAELGDFDWAVSVAQSIHDHRAKNEAYYEMVKVLLGLGRIKHATRVLGLITEGAAKAEALSEMARVRNLRSEDCLAFLREAIAASRSIDRSNFYNVVSRTAPILAPQLQSGGVERLGDALLEVESWWASE